MSVDRSRISVAAVVSASVLAGLAVAESGGAATSDTVTETSVAATPVTVPETSVAATVDTGVATTPDMVALEILPPEEPWAGLTRGEWDARFWQWLLSMPEDVNPMFEATGERCGYGQHGPVFFLPGPFEAGPPYRCVIAEGTAIYLPVAGAECSTVQPPFGRTEEELRACATAALDEVTDYQARVNGADVVELDAYRIGSPLFTVNFPETNFFGVEPGVAQAVSECYSFIIAPPPPGEYEIAWTARFPGQPATPPLATVIVTVEAPQVIEPPPTTT